MITNNTIAQKLKELFEKDPDSYIIESRKLNVFLPLEDDSVIELSLEQYLNYCKCLSDEKKQKFIEKIKTKSNDESR